MAAHRYGVESVLLVVNKADLPGSAPLLHELRHYRDPPLGLQLISASATSAPSSTGSCDGLTQLRKVLLPHTSIP